MPGPGGTDFRIVISNNGNQFAAAIGDHRQANYIVLVAQATSGVTFIPGNKASENTAISDIMTQIATVINNAPDSAPD